MPGRYGSPSTTPVLMRWRQGIPGISWLTRIMESISSGFIKRPCLWKQGGAWSKKKLDIKLLPPHAHTCTTDVCLHTCEHSFTHTIYTCKNRNKIIYKLAYALVYVFFSFLSLDHLLLFFFFLWLGHLKNQFHLSWSLHGLFICGNFSTVWDYFIFQTYFLASFSLNCLPMNCVSNMLLSSIICGLQTGDMPIGNPSMVRQKLFSGIWKPTRNSIHALWYVSWKRGPYLWWPSPTGCFSVTGPEKEDLEDQR